MSADKKRVTRPNKETYQAKLLELEQELKTAEKNRDAAQNAVKAALGGATSPQNEERTKLTGELNEIKKKQAELKSSRASTLTEIRAAEDGLQKKIKELQNLQSRANFKSVDEINNKIKALESQIESGSLRLVDEKRAIADISGLKKARTNFGQLAQLQSAIDADKAKVASIKANLDNSTAKSLSTQFDEIKKKLDAIHEAQQSAYKNRNSLFEKRDAARKVHEAARNSIHKHKDEYFGQMRAFREQAEADNAARIEREKAEKLARDKERRKEDAEAKLEEAQQPAFAIQIDVAENLLAHFDPEYKRPESNSLTGSNGLGAKKIGRVIEAPGTEIVKKQDESLFAGTASKKNRKKGSSESNKLTLNVGVIDDLNTLNIAIPVSKDDVENTISKIKEKIQFYKENQDRVTAERVERAKAEIAKLEADAAAEETSAGTEEEEAAVDEPATDKSAQPSTVEAAA